MAALKKWVEPAALAVSDPVYTQHNAMHGLTGDPMTKTRFRRSYFILLESWIPIMGTDTRREEESFLELSFQWVCNLAYILTVNLSRPLFALAFVIEPMTDCRTNTLDLCGEVL